MTKVRDAERETYEEMWEAPGYARISPGEQLVGLIEELCQPVGTLLDAGCGSGRAAVALRAKGYDVTLCDITREGLSPEAQALTFVETSLWQNLMPIAFLQALLAQPADPPPDPTKPIDPRFDWVICCDVLEHIPTEFVMLVVARLLAVTRRGVFLSIGLVPDGYGQLVGKVLHQTVQPYDWWWKRLEELGEVVEGRDLRETGVFLLRPRGDR